MSRTHRPRTSFVLAVVGTVAACSGAGGPSVDASSAVGDAPTARTAAPATGADPADVLATSIAVEMTQDGFDVATVPTLARRAGVGDADLLVALRSLVESRSVPAGGRARLGEAITQLSDQLAFAPGSDPFAGILSDSATAAIHRNLSDVVGNRSATSGAAR